MPEEQVLAPKLLVERQAEFKPIEISKSQLTDYGLDLNLIQSSESKTADLGTFQIIVDTGDTVLFMRNTTITLLRASLTTGGYKCQMTFRSYFVTWTKWKCLKFEMFADFLNQNHGFVLPWTLPPVRVECGWLETKPNVIQLINEFDPDKYDIMKFVNFRYNPSTWWRCP